MLNYGSAMPANNSIKFLLKFIRLCLTIAILIYLISLIDLDRVRSLIPLLKPKYAWPAFFLVMLTNLSLSIRWSLLLHHFNIKQGVKDSWCYYMIGGFYNLALPGMVGEDVVRLGMSIRSQLGKSKTLIATSILFERICGIFTLLMMASVGTLLVPALLKNEGNKVNWVLGITLIAFSSFSIFIIFMKMTPSAIFEKIALKINIISKNSRLLEYFRNLPFKTLCLILLFSIGAHLLDILGCFFLSKSLNIDQSFLIFLFIMPIVYVMTVLPISIGGLGVREGVFTYFLVKVGVLASDAVLLALMIYLNRVLVGLIGGLLQFTYTRRLSLKGS